VPLTTDAFTRADAGSLGGGWTDAFFFPAEGPADYFSIASNRAAVSGVTGGPNGGAKAPIAASENFDISVKVKRETASTCWMGIIARGTANNTFYYLILRGGSGDWVVRRIVAGTVNTVGSGSYTWNNGAEVTLRFRGIGSKLQVFIEGTQQGANLTDANITGVGDCGLYASSSIGGQFGSFDDFSALSEDSEPSAGFSEAFTRSDGAALGNDWDDDGFGSVDYFTLASNKALCTGTGAGTESGASAPLSAVADQDVAATITATAGAPWLGLVVRATALNTFYTFFPTISAGWSLRKYITGSPTVLASDTVFPHSLNTAIRVRLKVEGTTIKAWLGKLQVAEVTDSGITAAGLCGLLAAAAAGSNGTFDDFAAEVASVQADAEIASASLLFLSQDVVLPTESLLSLLVDTQIPVEGLLLTVASYAELPVECIGQLLSDALMGVEALLIARSSAEIPVQGMLFNYVESPAEFPVQASGLLHADAVIPVAAFLLINSVLSDGEFPVQSRLVVRSDAIIPIEALFLNLWPKESVPADEWTKEVSPSDVWVKESSLTDLWSKV